MTPSYKKPPHCCTKNHPKLFKAQFYANALTLCLDKLDIDSIHEETKSSSGLNLMMHMLSLIDFIHKLSQAYDY